MKNNIEKLTKILSGKYIDVKDHEGRNKMQDLLTEFKATYTLITPRENCHKHLWYVRVDTLSLRLANNNWEIDKKKIISLKELEMIIKRLNRESNYTELPERIIFNYSNKRITVIYSNNKIVRTEPDKNSEYDAQLGLVVALLKGLNLDNYRSIIEYAYQYEKNYEDMLPVYVHLLSALQQHIGLSTKQIDKLIDAVNKPKKDVNINGHIIKYEYKGGF